MDNLSFYLLLLCFIMGGSGITAAALISYLFLGVASLNHLTLFSTFSLFTYYLYGVLGMAYIALSTLMTICCGIMYWFDLSIGDLQKSATAVVPKDRDYLKQKEDVKQSTWDTLCQKTGLTNER